jgi:lipopolysaccharide/colanic/teichoic acid biosynthesis glycosyltransferase
MNATAGNRIPLAKRWLDIVIALAALVLLSPVILLIALLLFILEGSPILFCQPRPGYQAKIVRVCKFRTMRPLHDASGGLLPDEARISPIGKLLRRTSLDELPELVNVLRGEMSIVGPRPLLVQYLERYTPEQARRHEVLPGITGWAQVNGRNAISWEEKFRLDVWYVDHWSFWLDIRIILMTLWKLLTGEGISQPGRATMDEFTGPEDKSRK